MRFKKKTTSVGILLFACVFLFSKNFYAINNTYFSKNFEPINARTLVNKILKAVQDSRTLKYDLKLFERINGQMLSTSSSVKLQKSPRKLYLYLKGTELLWKENENNGNALVNPDGFPFYNLNLNPYGSVLRKNQHHTIHEIGFDYFADIIQNFSKKAGENFEKHFIYIGEEKCNNINCYKLMILFPEFGFENYMVKKNENLITIARKLKISEYLIIENNPQIDDYYEIKEGDKIKIPNSYAKTTTLYIDQKYFLPINIKIVDNKGLFEQYEYYFLQVNPKIADEEFIKTYKDYHFK